MTVLLRDLVLRLETLVSLSWAEKWDNVGLLAGDPAQTISRILVCQDWTRGTLARAQAAGALSQTLVVAYHPPWFSPQKRLVAEGSTHLLYQSIASGAALYSVHTALDAAPLGTNDALAQAAGLPASRSLVPWCAPPARLCLRVLVPPADAERVRLALVAAGAGRIGSYSGCSFEAPGVGTFLPETGAQPAVGQVGSVCRQDELCLTSWLPTDEGAQAGILAALRAAHPYEEPVFDVFAPHAQPLLHIGQGRIGELATASPFDSFVVSLKQALGVEHVLCALPQDAEARRPVQRVAVAAGAGRSLLSHAIRAGADVFITGELPHHDALAARDAGVRVVSLLHGVSERLGVDRFADVLRHACSELVVQRATQDVEPLPDRLIFLVYSVSQRRVAGARLSQ